MASRKATSIAVTSCTRAPRRPRPRPRGATVARPAAAVAAARLPCVLPSPVYRIAASGRIGYSMRLCFGRSPAARIIASSPPRLVAASGRVHERPDIDDAALATADGRKSRLVLTSRRGRLLDDLGGLLQH